MMSQPSDVLVASQYGPSGSSTRVRVYDWFDHLNLEPNHRYEYRGQSSNAPKDVLRGFRETLAAERRRTRLHQEAHDKTVLLSRSLSPFSRGRSEEKVLSAAAYGIYDFDDAIFAPGPDLLGRLFSLRSAWLRSVKSADQIIAGSEILADEALAYNRNVIVIPSCIEHTEYPVKLTKESPDPPRAVWIGSPSTEAYLQIGSSGLLRAHEETGLRLKVISAGDHSLGELDRMVDRVAWAKDTFANELASADFGIMPLPDNAWTRGKCAYKLLQYAAVGIPIIGSPVGANTPVLADLGGNSAATDEEWAAYSIEWARASVVARSAAGLRSRNGVVEKYSFTAWADTWYETVFRVRR